MCVCLCERESVCVCVCVQQLHSPGHHDDDHSILKDAVVPFVAMLRWLFGT